MKQRKVSLQDDNDRHKNKNINKSKSGIKFVRKYET